MMPALRSLAPVWLAAALLFGAAQDRCLGQDGAAAGGDVRQQVPPELARRIDDAVDRGVAFLSGRQHESGAWPLGRALDGSRTFDTPGGRLMFEGALGRTARAAEAMLDAGLPASDRRIVRAAAWIEESLVRLDRAPPPANRVVDYTSSVLRLRLRLGHRDERNDKLRDGIYRCQAADGTFSAYPGTPSAPQPFGWCSSTCHAMSALALARECGLEVDEEIVRSLRRALSRGQAKDGGWSYCPGYRPTGPESLSAPARPSFGGTTTSLAAYLLAHGSGVAAEALRADPVVTRGLAWIAKGFDRPRGVYGRAEGGDVRLRYSDQFYFDLLALSFVGERLDLREWDGLRWYERGAQQLLSLQGKSGEWIHHDRDGTGQNEGISQETVDDNTALALSFLARGRGRRAGSGTPEGAAVATGTALNDLDWTAAARLDGAGREQFFAAAFPLLARLDEREWAGHAGKFAALGTEVLPRLVDRLESGSAADRKCAVFLLQALLADSLEFDPLGSEEARRAGVLAWRKWLAVAAPSIVREGDRFVVRVRDASPEPK